MAKNEDTTNENVIVDEKQGGSAVTTKTSLKGLTVVFTGKFESSSRGALTRSQAEAECVERGGRIGGSVTASTSILVEAPSHLNKESGKAKKAREVGCRVLTPQQFVDEFL